MLIALIGLDGSGKTTQAKKLFSYFQKKGERVSYIHWLRFYPSKKNWYRPQFKKTDTNNSSKNSLFYIIIRIFLSVFNAFLVSIKIFFHLFTGRKVILDRYLIDELVQLRYKGLNKKLFLFFLKIVPVTKNIFYFEINPELALQREEGHDFGYFEKKSILYKQAIKIKKIKTIKVGREEEVFQKLLDNLL
jgi:thymidylate kinase